MATKQGRSTAISASNSVSNSISALLIAALLGACGGGGGGSVVTPTPVTAPPQTATAVPPAPPPASGAPALTGNIATDGFNWLNYRRVQVGLLPALQRNPLIDRAAQGHSEYQVINGISHTQVRGLRGFTGVELLERLSSAGYTVAAPYYFGEVIARAGSTSGVYLAEELVTAIYHRFVVLEPSFNEGGGGAAVSTSGDAYFTANFGANNGTALSLGASGIVSYPFAGQTGVPSVFLSNNEAPDPVPNLNEVGYPISVHADAANTVTVQSFSVRPRGGNDMPVLLLTADADKQRETPKSAAAIIPLEVLRFNTTYDVSFIGTVGGVPLTRNWSFTTQ